MAEADRVIFLGFGHRLSAALSWLKSLSPLLARVIVSSVPAELLPSNPFQEEEEQFISLKG